MIGKYSIKQACQILGREPGEVIEKIRKGGVQGVTVEQTDYGFTYILSRESINHLGTSLKAVPNYDNVAMPETAEGTVAIDSKKFDQEIKKIGVSRATIANVIGRGSTYISNCQARGIINKKALDELERIYGLDKGKVIVETPKPKPKAVEKPVAVFDPEDLRKAVCNGFMDAFLIILKEGYISSSMARTYESDTFEKVLQKSIFNAMNGVRNLEQREKNGLVPQKR